MNYRKIKQIHETKEFREANNLLNDGWILLNVYTNEGAVYVLGNVEVKNTEVKGTNTWAEIKAANLRNTGLKELERKIISEKNKMVSIGGGIVVEIR